VLEVFSCVRSHFVRPRDYVSFANLMFDLRQRHPAGRVLPAIAALDAEDCDDFVKRLLALARSVSANFAEEGAFTPPDHHRAPRSRAGA
jgi:hypothetical protein